MIIFNCLISNQTVMISINAIIFSNYMFCEVYFDVTDIRPPKRGFSRLVALSCICLPAKPPRLSLSRYTSTCAGKAV